MIMKEFKDEELLPLIRQNNEEALETLMKKYSPLIGRIASSYYGVTYDHQDFLQEGKMALFKAIETFDETRGASFYSYAMTCVRNAITTVYRKQKRAADLERLMEEPNIEGVKESYEAYQTSKKIDIFLNKKMILEKVLADKTILSDFEKQCLKYYLLDNNYKEIAAILGISPKKVDNALIRCKNKLKSLNSK